MDKMDKQNVFRMTMETMGNVEKENKNMSGTNKKVWVIQVMEGIICDNYGEDVWKEYKDTVEDFIEIAITLSKNKKLLNEINKTVKRCCFI